MTVHRSRAFVRLLLAAAMLLAPVRAEGPLVIAHRGASGYLPEHTLEAKALAFGMGADYIEQDVVLTKDGVLVVLHDIHLDTVTDVARVFPGRKRPDGRYYAIDFTLEEIRALRVRERVDLSTGLPVFPGRFPAGKSRFEVPTLAEELELLEGLARSSGRRAGIYPEIKSPAWHRREGKDISLAVLEMLRAHGYRDRSDPVYLQCFDGAEVRRIRRELGWEGRLVQLLGKGVDEEDGTDYDAMLSAEGLKALAEIVDGIGPRLDQIVAGLDAKGQPRFTGLVERAHALGLEVHPYTLRADALPPGVPDLEQALGVLFDLARVDGIFTDFPDRAVAFRARHLAPAATE